jgi:hypothetical protein
MPVKTYSTIVIMPDNSRIEVDYYCMDSKMGEKERKNQTELFIQLHDCICTLKIEKSICKDESQLERIVHNKVIHTKGHLC